MMIKYIDTKVILIASTKHSPNKIRARHIIGNYGESYAIKISKSTFNRIKKIYNRRNENYGYLYSHLNPTKCKGKTPADFRGCFTRGSTGDYLDQQHLNDMFDQTIIDMNIQVLDKLSDTQAHEFCDRTYEDIGTNKRHLGFLIDKIKESELSFENQYTKDQTKLVKELKKEFTDPNYKLDINILAECISDGINSNIDFEIIIGTDHFNQDKSIRKIYTAIKRATNQNYSDLIIPLYRAYG